MDISTSSIYHQCTNCDSGIFDQFFYTLTPTFNNNNSIPHNLESYEQLESEARRLYDEVEPVYRHETCLKCEECGKILKEDDEKCLMKENGKLLCLEDRKKFEKRCSTCDGVLKHGELVITIEKSLHYHPDCFKCFSCDEVLKKGEAFARGDVRSQDSLSHEEEMKQPQKAENRLFCSTHFEEIITKSQQITTTSSINLHPSIEQNNNNNNNNNNMSVKHYSEKDEKSFKTTKQQQHIRNISSASEENSQQNDDCEISFTDDKYDNIETSTSPLNQEEEVSANNNNNTTNNVNQQQKSTSKSKRREQKSNRIRTVLNEKQLITLRACYGANPRPDAVMKEQLCELTGLSSRVIRVWFQNKRCKDKKKSIMLKQMQSENGFPTPSQQALLNSGQILPSEYGIPNFADHSMLHTIPEQLHGMQLIPPTNINAQIGPNGGNSQPVSSDAWKGFHDFAMRHPPIDNTPFQDFMKNLDYDNGLPQQQQNAAAAGGGGQEQSLQLQQEMAMQMALGGQNTFLQNAQYNLTIGTEFTGQNVQE